MATTLVHSPYRQTRMEGGTDGQGLGRSCRTRDGRRRLLHDGGTDLTGLGHSDRCEK
jgi:hypothetical protein